MKVLNQHVPVPTLILAACEFFAASASVYLAGFVRVGVGHTALNLGLWRALLLGFFATLGLAAMGLYQVSYQRLSREAIVARIAAGLGLAALGELVVFFMLPVIEYGRGVWAVSLAFTFVFLVAARAIAARVITDNAFRRRIVVYGAGNMASSILKLRRRTDQRGFKVVAFLPAPGDRFVVDDERVRSAASILDLVVEEKIDEIVIAMDDKRSGFPLRELLQCKFVGVDVVDILDFVERESGQVDVERLNPSWIVYAPGFTRRASREIASRGLDLAGGLLLLAIAWPIMLLVALAILIEDGSPILYRQTRVGLFGRHFQLLKFRSMRKQAEVDGAQWAQKDDKRVTNTGRVIRKLRFDELPQVLNIIGGKMSLVGPRPERPEFVDALARNIPYYQERHCVKPGLTGWAQLRYPYGASEKDALQKLRYDLYYVKNQNFLLDLMILIQTAEVIIWQKGSR